MSPTVPPSPRLPVSPSTEEPPFGGSWRILYAVVLVNLAALVALFYLFTRYFG